MPDAIAITDTGVGIAPERLDALFRHEVKSTTPGTAGEMGSGLGLPLSQDIIRALGGAITVSSRPGEGSTFYVTLPRVRPKVLVVGRDEAFNLFVRPHLDELEADAVASLNYHQALERLERDHPHAVVVEALPHEEGAYTFLQRLQELSDGRMPVLLIVERSESELMERAFRLGVDDIIEKPLMPQEFIVRLRRYIG